MGEDVVTAEKEIGDLVVRPAQAVVERDAATTNVVLELLAVVLEVGEEAVNKQIGVIRHLVVHASAEAIPGVVIKILIEGDCVEVRRVTAVRIDIRQGLHVVRAYIVQVITVAEYRSKTLVRAKSLPEGRVIPEPRLTGVDRIPATETFNIERGAAAGGLFHMQVDRATDCISILVGRERLVDIDRTHKVAWDHPQVNLPHLRIGPGHGDAIDGGVAEAL